jgi:aspartate aminotransferase
MQVEFSKLAQGIKTETAFDVLAIAKQLKAAGKRVIELEIGDSPFPTTRAAAAAGIAAIEADHCHYGPSTGLPEFRQAAADYVRGQYSVPATADCVVAGPGAKNFETLFCEAFVNPGDGVLVFSPYFPTYVPNIDRRGGRITFSSLRQDRSFRPNLDDVEKFLQEDPQPKAIFLNSPHNPTGGIATHDDLKDLASLIRGRNIAVFCDEPYDQMVWTGQHHSLLAEEGMMDQCVAAYTFSKSFSMSGWRLGFTVSSPAIAQLIAKLTNTALSCVPPFVQMAGIAALQNDLQERDKNMATFRHKVEYLSSQLDALPGINCLTPGGSFYVFPDVSAICHRFNITSHGLAMYLLQAADDEFGVACLGGECFGEAGGGFLRFSCAEPDEKLQEALDFLPQAFERQDRIEAFLAAHSQYQLQTPYQV